MTLNGKHKQITDKLHRFSKTQGGKTATVKLDGKLTSSSK